METFRQYWDTQQPPVKVKKQALNIIDTAARVALSAKQGDSSAIDQIEGQLQALGNLHKELDKYSSHEIKQRIVKTYNKIKDMLDKKREQTAESLMDCVQNFQTIYHDILNG